MVTNAATIYSRIHREVEWHLRRIAHIDDVVPRFDGDELINPDDEINGVLARNARWAAAHGDAVEAIKRVLEIVQPGDDAHRLAWLAVESAASGEE